MKKNKVMTTLRVRASLIHRSTVFFTNSAIVLSCTNFRISFNIAWNSSFVLRFKTDTESVILSPMRFSNHRVKHAQTAHKGFLFIQPIN